jgi:hypothetical protein
LESTPQLALMLSAPMPPLVLMPERALMRPLAPMHPKLQMLAR